MKGSRPFLIKAKPSLVALLESADGFYQYLAKDVIITAELSDRHGLKFIKLFEQIKECYMASVRTNLPQIDADLGFDHYWTFEEYNGRVTTLCEVLQRAELLSADTRSEEMDYLIQTNVED
jgi:hypothetical protein